MVVRSKVKVFNCRCGFTDAAWVHSKHLMNQGKTIGEIAPMFRVSRGTIRYQMQFKLPPSERREKRAPRSTVKAKTLKSIAARRQRIARIMSETKEIKGVLERKRLPDKRRTYRVQAVHTSGELVRVYKQRFPREHPLTASTARSDLKALGFRATKRPRRPHHPPPDKASHHHPPPDKRLAFARRELRADPKKIHWTKRKKGQERGPGVNHQDYIELCLKPNLRTLRRKGYRLMEDGAKAHTAKVAQQWKKDHGIKTLEGWPGNHTLNAASLNLKSKLLLKCKSLRAVSRKG